MGFELTVDENSILTSSDLVLSDDGTYFKINPASLLEIKKSESCSVSVAEIQEIKNRVSASIGETPQAQQPVSGNDSSGQTQNPQDETPPQ
jgi:hypothetical protein